MSKTQKIEFKINSSPHLKMSEITKRLFNRNFHADVHFLIDAKIIYAHSLELIKRSVVFEQQLESEMGEQKIIPISDCKYESFYEFVRYIYTDECTINDDNFIDILKLATKYKFIKLENQVLSVGETTTWLLKCFDHSVLNKYEIVRNFVNKNSAYYFDEYLENENFRLLNPDTVEELLKIERIQTSMSELQIFKHVAEWILSYCKMHQLTIAEGRRNCDKLFKQIRFPRLSNGEMRECFIKYPGLLSESDRMSIASQAEYGGSSSKNCLWITKGRESLIWPSELFTFQHHEEYKTVFSVSTDTILYGIRIGIETERKPIEIEISEIGAKANSVMEKLMFVQKSPEYWEDLIISLGDSIRLKRNFTYTIMIKYLERDENLNVITRTGITNVIINHSGATVNIAQASANMLEMFFKLAPT